MVNEKFPEVQDGEPISAGRANREGQVLERIARGRPGSGMDGRHGESAIQFSRTLDAKLATLKVTDTADAPVYEGVLRQYNFAADEWSDGTKLWKIDTGAVGISLGVGEIVVAYYDRKRGAFIPVVGTGIGHRVIGFNVISAAPFVDGEVPVCTAVLASVQSISCEADGLAILDEVIVWDPNRCWFTMPLDMLVGSYGTATEMTRPSAWGIDICVDYEALLGNCWWQVTGLCCTEDIYGQ